MYKRQILTGAQLPIGVARTDARENIITALEIAAAQHDGKPIVPEAVSYTHLDVYKRQVWGKTFLLLRVGRGAHSFVC